MQRSFRFAPQRSHAVWHSFLDFGVTVRWPNMDAVKACICTASWKTNDRKRVRTGVGFDPRRSTHLDLAELAEDGVQAKTPP